MTHLEKPKSGNNLKKRPHEAQLNFIVERLNIQSTGIQGSATNNCLDVENNKNADGKSDE